MLPYVNANSDSRRKSELHRRHLPNVFRIRVRSKHNVPLCGRRCVPAVHEADVRRDGSQLGINAHWRYCPAVIANSVPL